MVIDYNDLPEEIKKFYGYRRFIIGKIKKEGKTRIIVFVSKEKHHWKKYCGKYIISNTKKVKNKGVPGS